MNISIDAALNAAGLADRAKEIRVLRDGFPSLVARVALDRHPDENSVIVKACPVASREMDTLLCLFRSGCPVPGILDVHHADGFQVIVMEDVGEDALYRHPDTVWYLRAARFIARFHASFAGRHVCDCEPLLDLPVYDRPKWGAVVEEGLAGTFRRLDEGVYTGLSAGEAAELKNRLDSLAGQTVSMLEGPDESMGPPTLIHGDYHEGNVLIRARPRRSDGKAGAVELVLVDWDSARWDQGLFDLVSLYDVADRMKTCRLDPTLLMDAYLGAMTTSGDSPGNRRDAFRRHSERPRDLLTSRREWRRCRVLRAWHELEWFARTGEDFGDRAIREAQIIESNTP